MVLVDVGFEKQMYIDGWLKQNYDILKEKITSDWDFITIISGLERAGKSVLAQQLARYVDPTFNIKRIAFEPEHFESMCVDMDEKYKAVIFDEAISGMAAEDYANRINKALKRTIVKIGQKNLFLFLCIPSFFDLRKYYAIHRSIALIDIYTSDNLERGYFKFFNRDKKRELYAKGKKNDDMKVVYPNFRGRFTNYYTVDEGEYRKLKDQTLHDANKFDNEGRMSVRYRMQRDELVYNLYQWGLNQTEIKELVEGRGKIKMDIDTISSIVKEKTKQIYSSLPANYDIADRADAAQKKRDDIISQDKEQLAGE